MEGQTEWGPARPASTDAPGWGLKGSNMKTIQEHVEELRGKFRRLSASRRARITREAREFCRENPGAADHSNFWRGLSARQVIGEG